MNITHIGINTLARLGKEFELLVSRIERSLSPLGAVITTPDKIPDKVANIDREVDASIRYTVGSTPLLITIECRDRTSVQDITWLEQIKSKKESIGAHQTIVVSKEGFSRSAIEYANHHAIALRQIEEVTDEFILNILNDLELFIQKIDYDFSRFKLIYWTTNHQLISNEFNSFVFKSIHANEKFIRTNDGRRYDLHDFVQILLDKHSESIRNELNNVTEPRIQEFHIGIPEKTAFIQFEQERHYVQTIILALACRLEEKVLPKLRPIRYTDENGKIIDSFSESVDNELGAIVKIKFEWDRIPNHDKD
ncbi:MAG: hypothetical protein AB7P76_10270 [Candidatus Melainabacteria bacterium]